MLGGSHKLVGLHRSNQKLLRFGCASGGILCHNLILINDRGRPTRSPIYLA